MDDNFYMHEAIKEAELSLNGDNFPIGCVIVLDDEIVSKGHNSVNRAEDSTAHAEMSAIRKIGKLLFERKGEAVLYTTYEPCPMCFGSMIVHRIGKIRYGINFDGSGATYLANNLPEFYGKRFNADICGGILERECAEIFAKSKLVQKLIKEKNAYPNLMEFLRK